MVYTVELSRQELSDFLDDNEYYMEQYRQELENRMREDNIASVEITDTLLDKCDINGEPYNYLPEYITAIMDDMVNNWDWFIE